MRCNDSFLDEGRTFGNLDRCKGRKQVGGYIYQRVDAGLYYIYMRREKMFKLNIYRKEFA